MKDFAGSVVAARIEKVNRELARLRRSTGEEEIHDVRVAIRRLQQALRLFRTIIGQNRAEDLRARLKPIFQAAGEVRNMDIALALADQAGVAPESPLRSRWVTVRTQKQAALLEILPVEDLR
jgi:CHAD domain-containing protein